jgi:hypothetical protein
VIEDFIKNQLKPLELVEVPNQNRYQIEEHFLAFYPGTTGREQNLFIC